MKVQSKKLSDQQRMEILDALYTAAGTIHCPEAMKLFLRDLLTENERIMLGRRILIARKLLSGEPVVSIAESLKVGYDTVYKIERWLRDQLPGYEQAVKGMEHEFKKREEKKLYATSTLYRLKKKYPLHFLLFPTPKLKNAPK